MRAAAQHFAVGADRGVAVELGADLQHLARAREPGRRRVRSTLPA